MHLPKIIRYIHYLLLVILLIIAGCQEGYCADKGNPFSYTHHQVYFTQATAIQNQVEWVSTPISHIQTTGISFSGTKSKGYCSVLNCLHGLRAPPHYIPSLAGYLAEIPTIGSVTTDLQNSIACFFHNKWLVVPRVRPNHLAQWTYCLCARVQYIYPSLPHSYPKQLHQAFNPAFFTDITWASHVLHPSQLQLTPATFTYTIGYRLPENHNTPCLYLNKLLADTKVLLSVKSESGIRYNSRIGFFVLPLHKSLQERYQEMEITATVSTVYKQNRVLHSAFPNCSVDGVSSSSWARAKDMIEKMIPAQHIGITTAFIKSSCSYSQALLDSVSLKNKKVSSLQMNMSMKKHTCVQRTVS